MQSDLSHVRTPITTSFHPLCSYKPPAVRTFSLAKAPAGSTIVLACPPKLTFSSVTSVTYGQGACKDTRGTASAALAKLCLGKASCTVAATKAVVGDPCPGKPKLLSAELVCAAPRGGR